MIRLHWPGSENTCVCKALLDSGAQLSFISLSLIKKLNIPTEKVDITVTGIGTTVSDKKTNLEISSYSENFKTKLCCHVLNSLPVDIPPTHKLQNKDFNEKIKSLELADPKFDEGGSIEIIIGTRLFWSCLQAGKIIFGENLPILFETSFGWVVVGPSLQFPMLPVNFTSFVKIRNIDTTLRQFWELQNCESQKSEDCTDPCEQLFRKTTTRDSSGRFVVRLPFKENPNVLGDSLSLARKRLFSLERKLETNPRLKQLYTEFLNEYEQLGHMRRVPPEEINQRPSYYIPTLGVLD